MAAFAEWHPQHAAAHRAVAGEDLSVVAHAAYETYSVLTRLREPHTMAAEVALAWIEDTFADRWLGLSAAAQRLALGRLQGLGISGGPTYDGLIAITAAAHDATLVTLDRRAIRTYALVGVEVELLA